MVASATSLLHWKDAVVGGYLIFVYVMVGLGFYFGATLDGEELFEDGTPDALCAILVLTMLVPDIILKVVMKHDSTAMDDYLKSRPVPEKVWNRFLLLTNLANFWNYVMPVLMLPMLFWMLSVPQAIVGYLLMQAFSFINGIYVTCYYKTTDWMLRWPLLLGWIGMGAILTAYLVCFARMLGFLINIGMAVWAVLIITGLLFYLYNLKIYNEHKQKTSRFRSFGKTTLYKLQYIGLLRAKRVRNMVLVMVIIFFLDALLMVFLPDEGTGNQVSLIMYVVGDVLLPSVVLSQWTFWYRGQLLPRIDDKTCQGGTTLAQLLLLLSEYQRCDDDYQFGLRLPFSRNNGIHLVGRHGYGCVCQPFQSAYLSLFVTVGNLLQLDVQHAGSQHEDQSLWYCLLGTFRSYGRCLLSVGS